MSDEMKWLTAERHIVTSMSATERKRFEAFLDRNFPSWRGFLVRNDGISCMWRLNVEGGIRRAIYRVDFVELYDEFDRPQRPETRPDGTVADDDPAFSPVQVEERICDIDGDLTPVGRWRAPNPQ